VLRAQVRG
jgi:hypothetical protein